MKISNGVNKKISTPVAIIIIIACAVLVGGVAIWQYFKMPKGEIPEFQTAEETQPESETAGWKTYRNEKYGFELKYPPFYEETKNPSKWILSGQSIGSFSNKNINDEITNLLTIAVFNDLFKNYKLLDQPGGFGFYFDTEKKQWLHLDDGTSEFVPKKMNTSIEAYIYKSGDIICAWDWIVIPYPSYSYVVEIANTTCGETYEVNKGVFDYKKPEFILDSKELLSTFRFLE